MTDAVLCLRPEVDFTRVGVTPPPTLSIRYATPADPDLATYVKSADALVIPAIGPKLTASLFDGGKVRLVQVTGAGVDRLDEPAMRKLGIPVANVPGGSNGAVAEYCVASALNLLRRLSWSSFEIKHGRYAAYRARMLSDNLAGLEGLTVGIVGLGTIGAAVATAFASQSSRIVYYDPTPRDAEAASRQGWISLSLDELLATAAVVTLHVPLLPATTRLIGAEELSRMKPDAILINAARGGIVDEAALAAALTDGKLGGAVVDVYSTEPPSADNPLLTVSGEASERLLLTPHIAGVTRQASATLFQSSWDNIRRVLVDGKAPLNICY
jgi:phosphoglycerate dehydrogenase-like enzyme